MEYACPVRDLHLKKDNETLQKFGLRVCSKSWSFDYAILLDTLSIPTLSDRRETLKLCLFFNNITYIPLLSDHSLSYTTRYRNTLQHAVS